MSELYSSYYSLVSANTTIGTLNAIQLIRPVGDCPVGDCPVGECPVGECPCTTKIHSAKRDSITIGCHLHTSTYVAS